MSIDWDNIQNEMGGDFKNFYGDGKYTAKCDGVEIKEVGSKGSVIMKFHFEETDTEQYPTADHWLTFKEGKDNWRQWHNKNLMQVLGATEEAAKKAVEMAESKEGKDNIVKGYETCYKKLLAKKPEVEIEVYTDENPSTGKSYARAEFLDRRVAMPHGDEDKKPADKADDLIASAEAIDLSEADLPF